MQRLLFLLHGREWQFHFSLHQTIAICFGELLSLVLERQGRDPAEPAVAGGRNLFFARKLNCYIGGTIARIIWVVFVGYRRWGKSGAVLQSSVQGRMESCLPTHGHIGSSVHLHQHWSALKSWGFGKSIQISHQEMPQLEPKFTTKLCWGSSLPPIPATHLLVGHWKATSKYEAVGNLAKSNGNMWPTVFHSYFGTNCKWHFKCFFNVLFLPLCKSLYSLTAFSPSEESKI